MYRTGVVSVALCLMAVSTAGVDLRARFENPPNEAKLRAWYHWLSDCVSEEGLRADIAAMRRMEIGGYTVVCAYGGSSGEKNARVMSDEWKRLVALSSRLARESGMEIGMHNCPGWTSSGGPWIQPENAMKKVTSVWRDVRDAEGRITLDRPQVVLDFYHDLRTVAFPVESSSDPMFVYPGPPGSRYEYRRKSDKDRAKTRAIPIADFVDLTDRLAPDGTLDLPRQLKGDWRIVRIGYTLTGSKNHPTTLAGLECDKLSPKGVNNHWQGYVEKLLAMDGAPTELLIDSYEVGMQTWTEGMDKEFARRCGYDLTPYLPALAGCIVESHENTEKFLFDFSRTVSDLMAENYYGRFAAKCRAAGVRSAVEPYFGPFDGFSVGKDFDATVGEFWLNQPKGLVRTATSLGHLYGKPFIAAESFSALKENGRWSLTPWQLKRETDWAWMHGINRITVHSYVHQPFTDRLPGMSLDYFGSHFNRNVPWWDEGVAWSRYVARGQSLLTAGYSRADVLIFNKEDSGGGVADATDLTAAGFDYDFAGYEIVAGLSAADGEVRFGPSPHGYRLLQIDSRNLTLRTIRKIGELLENGACIAALPPFESPSLGDDTNEVRRLVSEIWGNAGTGSVRSYGRGRLVLTSRPKEALAKLGIRSPFTAPPPFIAVSRQVEDKCVWFVSNPGEEDIHGVTEFAVGENIRSAELWDAVDGSCRPVAIEDAGEGRKRIDLSLPAYGSIFVVFSPEAAKPVPARTELKPLKEIAGPWQVTFAGLAAPTGTYVFASPVSWSDRPEPELNAFSGRATYRTEFDVESVSGRSYIELGDVRDVARVRVNGRDAGIAWIPPYRVEVTGLVKAGRNQLELEVANNWPNRLIGDARARKSGGQGVTWTNYKDPWKAEEKFLPAGLLGPVRLLTADTLKGTK